MRITPDFANEIKREGFDVVTMNHAYRINGVVDVWFNGKTLYNKKTNEYLKFDSREKLVSTALYLANQEGKQNPFKKTEKGKMSYQEFKHKEKTAIAEYYHWTNDSEISDKDLYFIKSGVHVKIGVSNNTSKRLNSIKTGTPEQPEIICIAKNKGHMEKKMHHCFSQWRVRKNGEWFLLSEQILRFVDFINKKENSTLIIK